MRRTRLPGPSGPPGTAVAVTPPEASHSFLLNFAVELFLLPVDSDFCLDAVGGGGFDDGGGRVGIGGG